MYNFVIKHCLNEGIQSKPTYNGITKDLYVLPLRTDLHLTTQAFTIT
jgi:hypothetical protein